MGKHKVLITGCGGMLGEAVYSLLKDEYDVYATDINLNESWLEHFDVSDTESTLSRGLEISPDFIIHLAALTDLEYCELHPETAYKINAEGTVNMTELARRLDIPLVYISTAGIFNGKKHEYTEEDLPDPLCIYGKSKYQGELAARVWHKSIVIRAGWMMGGGPVKDKKFVGKIIERLRGGVRELQLVNDKYGSPSYTYDLAKIIKYLLENRCYGIYHGTCNGSGSRYDVGQLILKCFGLEGRMRAISVGSDYFSKNYFTSRPASERLNNNKLKAINPELTRNWQECLREYLEKFDWGIKDA